MWVTAKQLSKGLWETRRVIHNHGISTRLHGQRKHCVRIRNESDAGESPAQERVKISPKEMERGAWGTRPRRKTLQRDMRSLREASGAPIIPGTDN